MTDETRAIRDKIRSYEIAPCGHGQECKCSQRMEWEYAVARVYEVDRREEALIELIRLSEEMGLYT
jgi:hypothetical protein